MLRKDFVMYKYLGLQGHNDVLVDIFVLRNNSERSSLKGFRIMSKIESTCGIINILLAKRPTVVIFTFSNQPLLK